MAKGLNVGGVGGFDSIGIFSTRIKTGLPFSSGFDLFQDGGDVTGVAAAQAQGRAAEARENCAHTLLRGKITTRKFRR